MKIAIIGGGIAGMVTGFLCSGNNDVTLFEAGNRIGGHVNTIRVEVSGRSYLVDTGFTLFNEKHHPELMKMLAFLGLRTQPAPIGFSIHDMDSKFEYSSKAGLGASLNPSMIALKADIARFHREGIEFVNEKEQSTRWGDYLKSRNYGAKFCDTYLLAMQGTLPSANPNNIAEFPARSVLKFLDEHGLLAPKEVPECRVITGGSFRYIEKLIAPYQSRIRLNTPIEKVLRQYEYVEVKPVGGEPERFDKVVIATHADQALALIDNPTDDEFTILGSTPYETFYSVLHTDRSVLPSNEKIWAPRSYRLAGGKVRWAFETLNLSLIENLLTPDPICITKHFFQGIDRSKVLQQLTYRYMTMTQRGLTTNRRQGHINNSKNTYYAGSYWGFGTHEDAIRSALAVGRALGKELW